MPTSEAVRAPDFLYGTAWKEERTAALTGGGGPASFTSMADVFSRMMGTLPALADGLGDRVQSLAGAGLRAALAPAALLGSALGPGGLGIDPAWRGVAQDIAVALFVAGRSAVSELTEGAAAPPTQPGQSGPPVTQPIDPDEEAPSASALPPDTLPVGLFLAVGAFAAPAGQEKRKPGNPAAEGGARRAVRPTGRGS